jgi:hypothetical protein
MNEVAIATDLAIVMVFYISGWMLRMWLSHREKMKGLSMTKQGLGSSDERLVRVEQAVESIAIEVERISEGQRYVTKMLNERAQPMLGEARVSVPAQARKMDTPH